MTQDRDVITAMMMVIAGTPFSQRWGESSQPEEAKKEGEPRARGARGATAACSRGMLGVQCFKD